MKFRYSAMIMAAGESRRFGGCKQLASFGNTTVLQHVVDVANSRFAGHVYAVTGRYHKDIAQQIQHAKFLYNPEWAEGLGKSIAIGVSHLAEQYDGILILLGDQVAIEPEHLDRFLQAFDNKQIICAYYNGSNGVPALFPRSHYHYLQRLNGAQGAKAVLNHPDILVKSLELTVAGFDIDTKEDLSGITELQKDSNHIIQCKDDTGNT